MILARGAEEAHSGPGRARVEAAGLGGGLERGHSLGTEHEAREAQHALQT